MLTQSTQETMTNRISNICAAIIAAWAFAMIGIEGAAHHQPTHSGTQEYVKYDRLAEAGILADPNNRQRLMTAFPEFEQCFGPQTHLYAQVRNP
jgi:hypothetical protein